MGAGGGRCYSRVAVTSILAWRIAWTEEPSGLQSIGSQRVGHNCSDPARTHGLLVGVASLVEEHRFYGLGSVVMAHRLSCPLARGIFPDQGSNPCPRIRRWILNHWTTREVLTDVCLTVGTDRLSDTHIPLPPRLPHLGAGLTDILLGQKGALEFPSQICSFLQLYFTSCFHHLSKWHQCPFNCSNQYTRIPLNSSITLILVGSRSKPQRFYL